MDDASHHLSDNVLLQLHTCLLVHYIRLREKWKIDSYTATVVLQVPAM